MRARKNGEGSYSVVTVKGVEYQRYRYANGKQIYARSMKELRAKKDKYEKELKEKNIISSVDLTLSEAMQSWLETRYGKIEPTSYDHFEDIILNHYASHKIGNYQIASITPEMLTKFFDEKKEEYALVTLDTMRFVLKSTFQYAYEQEIIPEFKLSKVSFPGKKDVKVPKKNIRIVTDDDIEKMYKEATRHYVTGSYVHPTVYRMLIFILYSGLRIGEAIGLQWDDVEKDLSAIHVNRTAARKKRRKNDGKLETTGSKTEVILKAPKTEKSYRTIPLPNRAVKILEELSNSEHKGTDQVFTSKTGKMVEYTSVFKALKLLIRESDCEHNDYTVHGLRHTYGSILIRKGVNIKIVSELLGHANVAFTYNVYIGVLKEDKIQAVSVLNNILN
jgi:integrase